MTERAPIVEVSQAVRQYGSGPTAVRALDDVSLSIDPGVRLAVVGPSGAGKSTLLSSLGLVDRLDGGTVTIAGRSANDLSEDERADLRRQNVGFVFQMFQLIPALSAIENVAAPLLPYHDRRTLLGRAERLLTDLGLGERLASRPGELSGGEQQRVGLARALIASPRLVLADEPTGNLDSRTAEQVVDMLLALQETSGFSLVVATHDMALADRLGHRIVMKDGRVVSAGD